jgi:hypothetical protein
MSAAVAIEAIEFCVHSFFSASLLFTFVVGKNDKEWFTSVTTTLYRNWSVQKAEDPNTLPFEHWVKDNVSQRGLNPSTAEDMDLQLLCRKPMQRATRYR